VGPLSVEQVLAQEVDVIQGPALRSPSPELHGLVTEQHAETSRANKDADARSGKDENRGAVETRKTFYRELNKLNRAALCCSGGGIRSATFCLGVIQALAMYIVKKDETRITRPISELTNDQIEKYADLSLLSRFHYLSTVSGGGYIGSWLSAWRTRDDFSTVWKNLAGRPDGPDVEPPEISWLRAYSNYLTPRVGLGSADTWTGAAIFLRNLILNWLVIVPAVAVVLLVLEVIATISVAVARAEGMWWLHVGIALAGVAFLIVAQAFTTSHRPTRRELPGTPPSADTGNIDQTVFLYRDLLWSLLSAVALTGFLTSSTGAELAGGFSTYVAIGIGAGIGVVIYAAGWLAGWPLKWECKDFAAWAASGLIYGGLLGFGAHLFTLLGAYTGTESIWIILIPVILGIPWVLVSQLFAEMVFVGLVSYELNSDADREWLGRCAGWFAATAVIWALTTFIAFAGGYFLIDSDFLVTLRSYVASAVASAGGVAGLAAALIGKSAKTPAQPSAENPGFKAIAFKIELAVAGPIFAAALVVGISVALDLLLLGHSLVQILTYKTLTLECILFWLAIGLGATGFVAWVASYSVNINRFSLHALYRNRLVRAYLGASRQLRCPDKLNGFDDDDNLPAHKLWPPKERAPGKNTLRLFHVVNITLNVVKSARLAWQQRKAESFTVSPLHCGAAYKGYRPSIEYGGGAPHGLSLGTAMAISGAAASPNMGYHSSPSITLLLALFNVRLGWWLGNPGKEGEKTYTDEGPARAIKPLVAEAFGLTTDDAPYVYLSDGGHFENLGLYEMVRRRCRYIVAVDAGCDPNFAFEDLGNAVRKIFIDLGVRITFEGLENLKNRTTADELKLNISKATIGGKDSITEKQPIAAEKKPDDEIPYHAIGRIHYRDADGADCKDGCIIYIKPAIHFSKNEGAGVRSYASANKTFPHESTGDQWFAESQFESYRSLGLDIMNNVLHGDDKFDHGTVQDFLKGLSDTV
jgi:hypothetical protein